VAFSDPRRLRDGTRECPAAIADISLFGLRVARERDLLIAARGRPKTIVSDNGTEDAQRDPALDSQSQRRLAFQRSRKTGSERFHREH
jgi:hypothetical protein